MAAGARKSRRPVNILNQHPKYSNQHGQKYETTADNYLPVRDFNLFVFYSNISAGSVAVPLFNSHVTTIAIVTDGRGYFEMACPHLSGRSSSSCGQRYEKASSKISKGTVFVSPAGHPTVIVADGEENLEVVGFEVNAEGNRRMFAARRGNVVSEMEREAKELAFGVLSRVVDEVFGQQKEDMFVGGPGSRREREEERLQVETVMEFP